MLLSTLSLGFSLGISSLLESMMSMSLPFPATGDMGAVVVVIRDEEEPIPSSPLRSWPSSFHRLRSMLLLQWMILQLPPRYFSAVARTGDGDQLSSTVGR